MGNWSPHYPSFWYSRINLMSHIAQEGVWLGDQTSCTLLYFFSKKFCRWSQWKICPVIRFMWIDCLQEPIPGGVPKLLWWASPAPCCPWWLPGFQWNPLRWSTVPSSNGPCHHSPHKQLLQQVPSYPCSCMGESVSDFIYFPFFVLLKFEGYHVHR